MRWAVRPAGSEFGRKSMTFWPPSSWAVAHIGRGVGKDRRLCARAKTIRVGVGHKLVLWGCPNGVHVCAGSKGVVPGARRHIRFSRRAYLVRRLRLALTFFATGCHRRPRESGPVCRLQKAGVCWPPHRLCMAGPFSLTMRAFSPRDCRVGHRPSPKPKRHNSLGV